MLEFHNSEQTLEQLQVRFKITSLQPQIQFTKTMFIIHALIASEESLCTMFIKIWI